MNRIATYRINTLSYMIITVIIISILCSCAPTKNNIYGGLFGQNVVGNTNYVTISNVWNEMDAMPLAEEHCNKYGRSARFSTMTDHRAIFDCLKP